VKSSLRARVVLLAAASGYALVVSACGTGTPGGSGSPASSSPAGAAVTSSPAVAVPASDRPFGAGCGGAVPRTGAGSFQGMAQAPVVLAASNDPALSSFVIAVQRANLSDSLDSLQGITVLAPVNAAFSAVPGAALHRLLADTPTLTAVLTHHVIQGRLTPGQLVGTHVTLDNDTVTIAASPTGFAVAAGQTLTGTKPARVICGNVQTQNATVYLIDQVLKPPAS
jgi:uncharacterized surface protein with fasciclin (FAS1) repeats